MRCLAASGFLQRVEELGCGFGFWILDLGMKKGFPEITGNPVRGAKGIRTPDPLHAMEMRYQLRHSPVELAGFEPATLCLQSRCATSCAIAP